MCGEPIRWVRAALELIAFGTPNADLIVPYGCDGDDILYVEADADNDQIEQYGGDGVDALTGFAGDGAGSVCQDGGKVLYEW